MMTAGRKLTYREYLLLGLIVALTIVIYSAAVHFEFTNWDDDIHVTNNPAVHDLSPSSIVSLFAPTDRYMYHPLTMLSYMIEWKMAGEDPRLFHATNILLHAVNVCLVFFLIFRLVGNGYLSLLTALLFALHPVQVESVAWISARKDLLSWFFLLSSVLSYYQWKDKQVVRWYAASIMFFVFSLLSKPSAVVLPLILITCDMIDGKRITRDVWNNTFVYFLISLMFTIFIVMTTVPRSVLPIAFYSLTQRAVLIMYGIGFYILKFFFPFNFSACYSYPELDGGSMSAVYYFVALIPLVLMVPAFALRNTARRAGLGLVFYCIMVLPVLQIIPFNNASLVADRYAYGAMIGLSLCLLSLVEILACRFKIHRNLLAAAALLLSGALCHRTIERLPVWSDSISLFTDVLEKNPNTAIAYGNRANARIVKGEFQGAIEDCNTLIMLFPDEPKAYYNRGNAYSELNRSREAVSDYSRSIGLGFASPNVFYNRANQYTRMDRFDSAAADYEKVLRLSPEYLSALVQLDYIARVVRHDYEKSISYLDAFIKVDPSDASMYLRRAESNAKLKRYGSALHDAAVALSLNRNSDTSGTFITLLNGVIDSINARITLISNEIHAKGPTSRRSLHQARSKLYLSLGDTLRAKNDISLSRRGLLE